VTFQRPTGGSQLVNATTLMANGLAPSSTPSGVKDRLCSGAMFCSAASTTGSGPPRSTLATATGSLCPRGSAIWGSSLPRDATPAAQADAYAFLLDGLGIERAAVFGYSAGGPSAIQFALRHAGRTTALILLGSPFPGKAGRPPKPVARVLFGSDVWFWALKTYTPRLELRVLGVPKSFHPTPEQWAIVAEDEDSLLPVRPRKKGALFDLYVSNPDVQHYPLEEISVPTLIMNAKDDSLSAFTNAARAAQRIKTAKLVPIERGGHLLLGSERRIQQESAAFISLSEGGR
jgi:pimeloyl-ACP methyl ester carboxylesterase